MFDPLHKWLGIPPSEQPPNHYRLLGVSPFETDIDVIEAAAQKQVAFLTTQRDGEYGAIALQILEQVSAAQACLKRPDQKQAYDRWLHSVIHGEPSAVGNQPPAPSTAGPPPVPNQAVIPSVTARPSVTTGTSRRGAARSRPRGSSRWVYSLGLCALTLSMVCIAVAMGKIQLHPSVADAFQDDTSNPELPPKAPAASKPQRPVTPRHQPGHERPTTPAVPKRSEPASPDTKEPLSPPASLGDLLHGPNERPSFRPDVPDDETLKQQLSIARDLFQDEYRSAKTAEDRVKVGKQLFLEGQRMTDDMAGRFALCQVGHDILAMEGEFELALAIIDQLATEYAGVDVVKRKTESLLKSSGQVAADGVPRFVDAVASVSVEACQEGDFESAKSLCQQTRAALGNRLLRTSARSLAKVESQFDDFEKAYLAYQAASQTLEQNHSDREANDAVGRYLCFYCRRWDKGLERLARGPDGLVGSAAQQELASRTSFRADTPAADAWWRASKTIKRPIELESVRRHALDLYRAISTQSKGLEQKMVDSRIAELEAGLDDALMFSADLDLVHLLSSRVETSTASRRDFAQVKGDQFELGIGARPDGLGEAQVGFELQDVKVIGVSGSASDAINEVDLYSKTGFVVDYGVADGFSKRVFLGLGLRTGRLFNDSPPWGCAKQPDLITDIGRAASYRIDLSRWAPRDWNGHCWFTVYVQNAGTNRALNGTISWERDR